MPLTRILRASSVVATASAVLLTSSLPAWAAGAARPASLRAAAPKMAASRVPRAEAATPRAARITATSGGIASLAEANLGRGACSTNSLGGRGYESSCTGNGGRPEYWCADLARWVWANAGVQDTSWLTAAAGSFYTYGLEYGTLTSTPAVGDAEVFDYEGGGYADHVAIVTGVSADGMVTSVSGDWDGDGASESAFSSTSSVVDNTPAYQAYVGAVPWVMGMRVSGFVAPVGVAVAPVVGATTVASGDTLVAGQSVTSPNGRFTLDMQADGNLVEYLGTRALWSSRTHGNPGARAVMQTDGNLVVYSTVGKAIWATGTSGHAGATLDLRDTGGLAVITRPGASVWSADPSTASLGRGATLGPGQVLVSANGTYELVMQSDGNLVESTAGRVLWDSRTSSPGARAVMQTDGNLVVYTTVGKAIWATGTSGHDSGVSALLADSGALVLRGPSGTIFSNGQ